jgi:hypothetical protein
MQDCWHSRSTAAKNATSCKCLCHKVNRKSRDYNLFPTSQGIAICMKISLQVKEK